MREAWGTLFSFCLAAALPPKDLTPYEQSPKQGLYSPINKVVLIAQQTWFSGCYGCADTGKWRGHAAGAGTLFCPVFSAFCPGRSRTGTGQWLFDCGGR